MSQMMAQHMAVSKSSPRARSWRQRMARWAMVFCGLWLTIAAVLMSLLIWGQSLSCPWLVAVYLGATVLGSVVCFLAYGLDKRRASAERFRISEATLHWLAFLGGWPGGYIGQQTFRHKTQKVSFLLVFWLIVSLHLPLMILCLWSIRFGS
jgi:uncharacterized membrane protein YsdA (DUF1294 family)